MIGASFIFNPRPRFPKRTATAASRPGLLASVNSVERGASHRSLKPGNVVLFFRGLFSRALRTNETPRNRPALPEGDCWPVVVLNGELVHTGWVTPPVGAWSPGEVASSTGVRL